jgi:hypothetical protein
LHASDLVFSFIQCSFHLGSCVPNLCRQASDSRALSPNRPPFSFSPLNTILFHELLHSYHKDLEAFLTHTYRAIASVAPPKDKVNVPTSFETLCTGNSAANNPINFSLTNLSICMLRNARAPTLRIRLASVLGLLVRHATSIPPRSWRKPA